MQSNNDPAKNIDPSSDNDITRALSELGREDSSITLESTLARVGQLRTQRTRRRIAFGSVTTLALLSLGVWLLQPTPSSINVIPQAPFAAPSAMASQAQSPETASPAVPMPALTQPAPPAPTRKTPSLPGRKVKEFMNPHLVHDVVLRALDFNKAVYEEIATTIGSNDDVVMVENKHDKVACMQVVCEGGDKRTLYCSAPSPSPVMITSPSGRKVMRVEGGVTPSSHLIALRTRLHRDSVLVWYEASPAFLQRLQSASNSPESTTIATVADATLPRVDLRRCAPSRMIDGTIRMDVTRCGSHERVVRVELSDLAGRPIQTEATYTQGGDGKAAIVLSNAPAGVAYVRLTAADGTTDSFAVAVP